MRSRKLLALVLMIALLLPAALVNQSIQAQTDGTIVWAFVPSDNSQQVLASADAFARLLSNKTNLKITTIVAREYAGVIEAMCSGQAQMGALNTFGYVLASSRKCADVALVSLRNNSTSYRGQIITRANSGITKIEDLKGKTFCRPDPLSTSGWIIPSITMKAAGVDPAKDLKQVIDASGHEGVVEQVYNGKCDAGATRDDARIGVEKKYPDVREKVVVIAYSVNIPNDTIAFTPSFDAKRREAIVKALLEIVGDKANAEMIGKLYGLTGLAEGKDAYFDDLRKQLASAGMKIDELMPKPNATAEATVAATTAR